MKFKFILSVLLISLFFVNDIMADHRSYIWTYEYQTTDSGEAEIEQYTTFSTPEIDSFRTMGETELNFEIEVGMNKHFDFGIYQVFNQFAGKPLEYSGFKLRGRYRFFEKNEFFLDPLLYVEYIGNQTFSQHEFEAKLILAKDIGKFNMSFNPYFELANEENRWEFVPKYAIGFSYHPSELFSAGFELKGDDHGNYIGPTISHGNKDRWIALGTLFNVGKVDEGSPSFLVRMIIGIGI
ncbi:MAG: hypothetical protein EPN82_06830 [Bacteroidetes bacterium]|nr:MAG: hypothetical protein EPN82_06830 [Bacteroidota bacterium]